MKNLMFCIAVLGFVLSGCKETAGEKAEVTEAKEVTESTGTTVVMNTDDSTISWGATKVTGASHTGEVSLARGSVTVKDRTITGGSFIIDMNSINVTDLEGKSKTNLEAHLKGTAEGKEDHFFNVAKYPTATFEITKVVHHLEMKDDVNSTIYGNLAIRDQTKQIGFDAKTSVDNNHVNVTTKPFTINRTDWGVNYGSSSFFDNLGDKAINNDISLKLSITGGKAAI
jgi:polyisoprenoid-binding protein YceI